MTFIPTTPYSKTTLGVAGWLSAEFFHVNAGQLNPGSCKHFEVANPGSLFRAKNSVHAHYAICNSKNSFRERTSTETVAMEERDGGTASDVFERI